jgi:hypothetical protein
MHVSKINVHLDLTTTSELGSTVELNSCEHQSLETLRKKKKTAKELGMVARSQQSQVVRKLWQEEHKLEANLGPRASFHWEGCRKEGTQGGGSGEGLVTGGCAAREMKQV